MSRAVEPAVESSDAELVAAARAGDREAFGVLVDRHQRRVLAVAAGIAGDFHDAEDLAQEAFVRAFRSLDTLRDPARFAPWVGGIAAHVALDWIRGRRGRPTPRQDLPEPAFEPGLPERLDPPAAEAELALVREIALGLPDDLRVVLTLRAVQGLAYAEIAQALGIEESQVKGRLHRAREELRRRLGRYRSVRRGHPLPRAGEAH